MFIEKKKINFSLGDHEIKMVPIDETTTFTTTDHSSAHTLDFTTVVPLNGDTIFTGNTFTITNTLGTAEATCEFCEEGHGYFKVGDKSMCAICLNERAPDRQNLVNLIGDLLLQLTMNRKDDSVIEKARDVLRDIGILKHIKSAKDEKALV